MSESGGVNFCCMMLMVLLRALRWQRFLLYIDVHCDCTGSCRSRRHSSVGYQPCWRFCLHHGDARKVHVLTLNVNVVVLSRAVERFGKYLKTLKAGFHILIPLVSLYLKLLPDASLLSCVLGAL